jgi:hypothetical protein
MKVTMSVGVLAWSSLVFVGVAHAQGAPAVVAVPAAVVVPVGAIAAMPVVVPTQEVPAEAAPEAPAAVVAAPVVAAPVVVVPVVTSPAVATAATVEPVNTLAATAPPPVVVPDPAPAPAAQAKPAFNDPFAAPSVTPLWSTGSSAPVAASATATPPPVELGAPPLPISPQSPYGSPHHPKRPQDYQLGVGMMFGGGVTDFASPTVREMTGTGGAWDVRLIFGQREVLALETAYVGSAHYISANGLDSDAMLVSNGAEGVLRLNIPVIDHGSIIEPFGFVGLGWSRYELTQTAYNSSSISTVDNVMEVPYGAGLTMGSDGFLVDIRFTYRATYYDNMMRLASATNSGDNMKLDSWSLGAHIGFEF